MANLVDLADIQAALSPATVVQCFNDNRDGVPDAVAVLAVCKRATAQALSWIVGHYTLGTAVDTDDLVRAAALDYAIAYTFERHPEYVRTFGEGPRAERWTRAEDTMGRIKAGIQRPVSVEISQGPSKTVGGVIRDDGVRMFVPGPDGSRNNGDF